MPSYFFKTSEDLGLWPIDENGNDIIPDDYDVLNPVDDLNFVAMGGGLSFVAVLGYSIFEGLQSGQMYIDRLKS